MNNGQSKEAKDYLRLPYARVIIPDDETGTYTARMIEFDGCIEQGNTPEEAFEYLEETAKRWIQGSLDRGLEIPEPFFTGISIQVNLPKVLYHQAELTALREKMSLNAFIVTAISERVVAFSKKGIIEC